MELVRPSGLLSLYRWALYLSRDSLWHNDALWRRVSGSTLMDTKLILSPISTCRTKAAVAIYGKCIWKIIFWKWLVLRTNETTHPRTTLYKFAAKVRWGHLLSWRRHHMGTLSALLALYKGNPPVTVDSPKKSVIRSFVIYFVFVSLNKLLNKQPSHRWSWWRHEVHVTSL